jgi:hypothetical protein
MRKTFYSFLVSFLLFINNFGYSQELSAVVLDSLNQNPIPFASIYLKSGSGAVSNEEGRFQLNYKDEEVIKDSLFISCMGYKTLRLSLDQLQDSTFYLQPKAIALKSVILSNKQLSAKEIIKAIQEAIPQKYELGLTEKKVFFRETGNSKFEKLNLNIKKTTIEEFNQVFWDSILTKIPKTNQWYQEFAGTLYGDYTKGNQKMELDKALDLEDKEKSDIFKSTEKLFDNIIKENVKSTSYFKVRSGIIGAKLETDEINSAKQDTLSTEEKELHRKKDFLSWKKNKFTNLLKNLFKENELNISILNKASKYNFSVNNLTFFGDTPVYILDFSPKKNADFAGRLYVDADRLALIRLEYKNIQNITDFSMLGVSYLEDLKEVIVQFKKGFNGKYSTEYLEFNSGFKGGFERPFVITEKNKVVRGRNKQNYLKMDLDIATRQYQKYQLVIFETTPISQEAFDAIKEEPKVLPVNLTEYDPNFWEGYSIIEPNKAIKAFKVVE